MIFTHLAIDICRHLDVAVRYCLQGELNMVFRFFFRSSQQATFFLLIVYLGCGHCGGCSKRVGGYEDTITSFMLILAHPTFSFLSLFHTSHLAITPLFVSFSFGADFNHFRSTDPPLPMNASNNFSK